MGDNVTLPATGQVLRTIEIDGIDYPVCILADGTLGAVVGTTNLTNGRGLNVVMLNDAACKGLAATGADVPVNPVFMGQQVTTTLLGTPLANGKLIPQYATGDGRQIVVPWCAPQDQLATTPVALTAQTPTTVQLYAGQAAGVRIALLGGLVANSSDTDTEIIILDGTTEVGRLAAPRAAGTSVAAPATFPLPIRGTAATSMSLSLSAAATTVRFTPFAFKTML